MKTLTLIFTYNTSLEDWFANGSADREIAIYSTLLTYFDKIYFITYGDYDKDLQERLPKGIVVLPKKYRVHNLLYSLLIPFIYKKQLLATTFVKTNQMMGSWVAVLIKVILHKRIVIRTGYTESLFLISKGVIAKKLIVLLERISYAFADIAIVTTNTQRDYLMRRYNASAINVVPNGIDTTLFTLANAPVNTQPLPLLFVGRLHQEKNVLNLVEALRGIEDIALTIIGDGPLKDAIVKIKEAHNLPIKLIARVPNAQLPTMYTSAAVYIQPSVHEGNPKTILEAMSCGLPVIATDVDGINNIITHNDTGYLCDLSPASIRNAILALRDDKRLRERLGDNARNYILKRYDIRKTIGKEIDIYKSNTHQQ